MKKITVLLLLSTIVLFAQVEVAKIEVLDLGTNTIQPVFSQDGQYLVFGSTQGGSYYNLKDKIISHFAESAYDYSMDAEGDIRYRVDTFVDNLRRNSVKVYDSKINKTSTVIDKKRLDIVPKVTDHGVYYIEKEILKTDNALSKAASKPVVFSYENALLLYTYGTAKMLKPAGEDKLYVWPSVSPDSKMISFVDVNDLYVTDMNGNILFTVNEARAPKWSPDGKWIVFMRDSDDGHVFTSSDLYVVILKIIWSIV